MYKKQVNISCCSKQKYDFNKKKIKKKFILTNRNLTT